MMQMNYAKPELVSFDGVSDVLMSDVFRRTKVSNIPSMAGVWVKLKEIFDKIPGDFYIAGGSIPALLRNSEVSDYDLYFKSQDDLNMAVNFLNEEGAILEKVTERAFNFIYDEIELDLVRKIDIAPEHTLKSFDFNVCKIAVLDKGLDEPIVVHSVLYFQELIQNILMVDNPQNNVNLFILRMCKYLEKGYVVDMENLLETFQHFKETLKLEMKDNY